MKVEIRKSVPLPFLGNKSKKIDSFIDYIKNCPDDLIYVDLFGGSCYLSYVIHQLKPNAEVICNDFDDYRNRLNNVDKTNEILKKMKELIGDKAFRSKFTDDEKDKIKNLLSAEKYDSMDVITLSACLMFSSLYCVNLEQLFHRNLWYNKIPLNDYDASWYLKALEGIKFVKKDWQELYNEYKDNDKVCFIADPPYAETDQTGYKGKWSFNDSLRTIKILNHKYFVYYTSEKSKIYPLIETINREFQPLKFDAFIIQRPGANKRCKVWNDIMLYNQ